MGGSIMQDLGKILMIPKGDYEGLTTYEFLDVVNHNESSWICKKECRGQEPSDANVEYWQKIGTAVDLQPILNGTQQVGNAKTLDGHGAEYFFPKSGGTIKGHVSVSADTETQIWSDIKNPKRRVYQVLSSGGTYDLFDATNNKTIINSKTDGTSTFNGTASGNLPLSGGNVKNNSNTPLWTENGNGDEIFIGYNSKGANHGYLGFSGANKPTYKTNSGTNYDILHTGNGATVEEGEFNLTLTNNHDDGTTTTHVLASPYRYTKIGNLVILTGQSAMYKDADGNNITLGTGEHRLDGFPFPFYNNVVRSGIYLTFDKYTAGPPYDIITNVNTNFANKAYLTGFSAKFDATSYIGQYQFRLFAMYLTNN